MQPQPKEKVALSKSAKRRRRSRVNRNTMPIYTGSKMMTIPASIAVANNDRINRQRNSLSASGMAFLKCAFAPPDFAYSRVTGVPDNLNSMTVCKKHKFTNTLASIPSAATDVFIGLFPTPGIAYWYINVTPGSPVAASSGWTPVPYPDSGTFFGSTPTSLGDAVEKYRFVSNHLELIPLVNQMQWSGVIQAFKLPLQVALENQGPIATSSLAYTLLGVQGINSPSADQYTGPVINGVYTAAYSNNPTFNFNSIIEGQITIPSTLSSNDFTFLATPVSSMGAIPGFDNGFESVIIKISGCTTQNPFVIKTWSCVEYMVNPSSIAYEFRTSTPTDERAMKLYREIISQLPIGVAYMDNDNFWQRVLSIIRSISGGLSLIPGPYGLAAGGVHSITQAIDQLL